MDFMEIFIYILSTIALLLLIVGSCTVFTNGVEHLGKAHNLNHGATGSILAAIGTALPETIVPLVAILGAYFLNTNVELGKEIGIGAILGSPFLLSTLAMFLTGLAIFIFHKLKLRNLEMTCDSNLVLRDLKFFLLAYSTAIFCGFIHIVWLKYSIAIALLAFYLVYATRTIQKSCDLGECGYETIEPLYLAKHLLKTDKAHSILIWIQIIFSILGLIIFAHLFVENIKFFSEAFGLNPMILSLILAPIATELPEIFNSIIWVRSSKDTLAMNNISGAMVFQASIPTAIGILLTSWTFTKESLTNITFVYLSVILIILGIFFKKKLSPITLIIAGIFYFVFLGLLLL